MRYIDLSIIEEKVKKINWTNALNLRYSHLKHLTYTQDSNVYIDWNSIEEFHLSALEPLSAPKRKAYIKKFPDWNILKSIFISEFGNKCWYSEAPLDNGMIDHFRPKSKAINYCADESDAHHKYILKVNGYWRLAYNLKNFRLSSNTSNTRFTDLETDSAIIGGKSIYFPLKFEDGKFVIADDYDKDPDILEKPLLLDPIKQADSGLITFDKDGNTIICGHMPLQKLKASISINLYNLGNTLNFVKKRQEMWVFIEKTIIEASKFINNESLSEEARQREEDRCFAILRQHIDKKQTFSSVALACFKIHQINPDYKFLNHFNP